MYKLIYETKAEIAKISDNSTLRLILDGRWCIFDQIHFYTASNRSVPKVGKIFKYRILERDDKTRYFEFIEYRLFERIRDKIRCFLRKHEPKSENSSELCCKFCNKKYFK